MQPQIEYEGKQGQAALKVVVLLHAGNIEVIQQFVRVGVSEIPVKPVSSSMLEAAIALCGYPALSFRLNSASFGRLPYNFGMTR